MEGGTKRPLEDAEEGGPSSTSAEAGVESTTDLTSPSLSRGQPPKKKPKATASTSGTTDDGSADDEYTIDMTEHDAGFDASSRRRIQEPRLGMSSVRRTLCGGRPTVEKIASGKYEAILRSMDSCFKELVMPEAEHYFINLRRLDKVNEWLREPTRPADVPTPPRALSDLLSGGPQPGRLWEGYDTIGSKQKHSLDYWRLRVIDRARYPQAGTVPKSKDGHIEVNIKKARVPTLADARRFLTQIVLILNNFPGSVDPLADPEHNDKKAFMAFVTATALRSTFPDLDTTYRATIHWHPKEGSTPIYRGRINYYSLADNKAVQGMEVVLPDDNSERRRMPRLSNGVKLRAVDYDSLRKPGVAEADKPRHDAILESLAWIISEMHDQTFANSQDAEDYYALLRKKTLKGTSKTRNHGPYKGAPIFLRSIQRAQQNMLVTASSRVRQDIGASTDKDKSLPNLPQAHLNTCSFARFSRINDIALGAFHGRKTVFEMLKAAYAAADYVNQEISAGEPDDSRCLCTPQQRRENAHSCHLCGDPEICANLQYTEFFSTRVCDPCAEDIGKSQFGGLTLKDMLRRQLLLERRRTRKNFDVDAREKQIIDAIEQIFAVGPLPTPDITKRPVNVQDIYFKLRRDHKAWKRGQGLQPFGPTIEAIRQWLHFIDISTGQEDIGVHVPGNIGFLAFWANVAKSDTICGIFSVIHDLLQPNIGIAKVRQLMTRVREIWIVTIKDSFTKRARVHNNGNMSQADRDIRQKEWQSGRQVPLKPGTKQPWMRYVDSNTALERTNYVSKPNDWEPPEHTRKLARDIVTNHRNQGVNVRYSTIDPDCPWIGDPESMPEQWSWWYAWLLFGSRLFRMWIWCNGKWILIETIETIYLECLVQWCAGNRGFLGLLWTGNIRHAFRFALAHARHGIGMATAWTVDHPRSWDQRDESRCTIRVMTHFENCAEWDFDDVVTKDKISAELRDQVDLPKELYDDSVTWGNFVASQQFLTTSSHNVDSRAVGVIREDDEYLRKDYSIDEPDDEPITADPSVVTDNLNDFITTYKISIDLVLDELSNNDVRPYKHASPVDIEDFIDELIKAIPRSNGGVVDMKEERAFTAKIQGMDTRVLTEFYGRLTHLAYVDIFIIDNRPLLALVNEVMTTLQPRTDADDVDMVIFRGYFFITAQTIAGEDTNDITHDDFVAFTTGLDDMSPNQFRDLYGRWARGEIDWSVRAAPVAAAPPPLSGLSLGGPLAGEAATEEPPVGGPPAGETGTVTGDPLAAQSSAEGPLASETAADEPATGEAAAAGSFPGGIPASIAPAVPDLGGMAPAGPSTGGPADDGTFNDTGPVNMIEPAPTTRSPRTAARVLSPERLAVVQDFLDIVFKYDHSIHVQMITPSLEEIRFEQNIPGPAFDDSEVRAALAAMATSGEITLSHNQSVVTAANDYDEVVTTVNELAAENKDLIANYVSGRALPTREDMSADEAVKQSLMQWLQSNTSILTFAAKFRDAIEPLNRSDLIFLTKIVRQIAAGTYKAPAFASHLSRALKRFGAS